MNENDLRNELRALPLPVAGDGVLERVLEGLDDVPRAPRRGAGFGATVLALAAVSLLLPSSESSREWNAGVEARSVELAQAWIESVGGPR